MVLQITNYLTSKKVSKKPMNTDSWNYQSNNNTRIVGFNNFYKKFWDKFKSSPELLAPISVLASDIFGDRPEWLSVEDKPLDRNKLLEAKRFWRKNKGKTILKEWFMDAAVTGNGYLWKGKATSDERMIAVKEAFYNVVGLEMKSIDQSFSNKLMIKAMNDVDLKKIQTFEVIASSTVTINATPFGVDGYTQWCAGQEITFKPEDVIHYRFMKLNGELSGFSPLQSLARELALLYFVKGNMLAYMENGGRPDQLFIMENTRVNDESYKRFEEQLGSYADVNSSHGALVGTGKVNVIDLNKGSKDMEYQNLALFITSNIAYAYRIPVNRIPYLMGKASSGGDSGGLADSGYWNMISEFQDTIEDLTNYEMFESLGWHISFPRKYKQDAMRDAQVDQMKVDTLQKTQELLGTQNKKLKDSKLYEKLGLTLEDVEDKPEEEVVAEGFGSGYRNGILDNAEVEKEPDRLKKNDDNRKQANDRKQKFKQV